MTIAHESMRVATFLPQVLGSNLRNLKIVPIERNAYSEEPLTGCQYQSGYSGKPENYFEFRIQRWLVEPQVSQAFAAFLDKATADIATAAWSGRTLDIRVNAKNMEAFADLCEEAVRSLPTRPSTDKALAGRVSAKVQALTK